MSLLVEMRVMAFLSFTLDYQKVYLCFKGDKRL